MMTRVKICGITNLEDARLAAEVGADLLGLIFYPPSPRYVNPEQACRIVQALRDGSILVPCVGVFVDETLDAVRQIMVDCGLDYAQLHGEEPPEMAAALLEEGFQVVKAFRVRDGAFLAQVEDYPATAYLLDTYIPGQPGGTGQSFDWALAAQASVYGPVILAGGLTPGNVAQAVRTARPWGVDVASGVEAAPGRKDPPKVRCFIATVKNAG